MGTPILHLLLRVFRDCCRTRDGSHQVKGTMTGRRKNLNDPQNVSRHDECGSPVSGSSSYERQLEIVIECRLSGWMRSTVSDPGQVDALKAVGGDGGSSGLVANARSAVIKCNPPSGLGH
jgi:hypothetical protein